MEGEWYQCVESSGCALCAFNKTNCDNTDAGSCAAHGRSDGKPVVFKKLTKYMHPFFMDGHRFQLYLLPEPLTTPPLESEEVKLIRWDTVQIMETI